MKVKIVIEDVLEGVGDSTFELDYDKNIAFTKDPHGSVAFENFRDSETEGIFHMLGVKVAEIVKLIRE